MSSQQPLASTHISISPKILSVPRDSETPYASELTSISTSATPHVYQENTMAPLTLAPKRAQMNSRSLSLSSVQRKPLPPIGPSLAIMRYSLDHHVDTRPSLLQSPTFMSYPVDSLKFQMAQVAPVLPRKCSAIYSSKESSSVPELSPELSHELSTSAELQKSIPCQSSPSLSVPESLAPIDTTYNQPWITSPLTSPDSASSWLSETDSIVPPHLVMPALSPESHSSLNRPITSPCLKETDDLSLVPLGFQPMSPTTATLSSFFSWPGNISPALSTTTFSQQSSSPISTPPASEKGVRTANEGSYRNKPLGIDLTKANINECYFEGSKLQLPQQILTPSYCLDDMERELQEISSELAASIRREMELEDLVEQLQSEAQNVSGSGRRTSDYFSDSGTSSVKYGGEPEYKNNEIVRIMRKNEQDVAQIKLELNKTVHEERMRRKELETQVRILEEKASRTEFSSTESVDVNKRIKELEENCEDLRRRLVDERKLKENFEDLLVALKRELRDSLNERDNLRDEIVPQLRARVEGLELQAAEHEKLAYEQSKTQQEIHTIKGEKLALMISENASSEISNEINRFATASTDSQLMSFNRPNSFSLGSKLRLSPQSRTLTVKTFETKEALADRVKDIELQRDSLHLALKSLLERQEHQNRENQKKINQLEAELGKALSTSPKRPGYESEVRHLRIEINALRTRADEATQQKWQCEKGLSGLKMDLDRAEQDISSLRTLIDQNDLDYPKEANPGNISPKMICLENSFYEMKNCYSESLRKIISQNSSALDAETLQTLQEFEQVLLAAVTDREHVAQETTSLRERNKTLVEEGKLLIEEGTTLAEELRLSSQRVEDLSAQISQQLATNGTLRRRLAQTIERSEKDQEENARKIMSLQSQLRSCEDQLVNAQHISEDRILAHEEDIRDVKDSHNRQLQRTKLLPHSPLTPTMARSIKSPRYNFALGSVADDIKIGKLWQKITDLEKALSNSDSEMELVVGRMNAAQIQVMNLQNDREEALRETKRLQQAIDLEKAKATSGTWTSLLS